MSPYADVAHGLVDADRRMAVALHGLLARELAGTLPRLDEDERRLQLRLLELALAEAIDSSRVVDMPHMGR
jgi:hypothetical protein